jgi:hypothetical protein
MAKELTDAEIEAAAKRIADGIEKISQNNAEIGPVKTKKITPRSTYRPGRNNPIPGTENYTKMLEESRGFGTIDFTTDRAERGEDSAVARLIKRGHDDEISL